MSRRRRWIIWSAIMVVALFVMAGGYGVYLAGSAGMLPWQPEPTRIAITPFAGIPGFGAEATPTITSTPTS